MCVGFRMFRVCGEFRRLKTFRVHGVCRVYKFD